MSTSDKTYLWIVVNLYCVANVCVPVFAPQVFSIEDVVKLHNVPVQISLRDKRRIVANLFRLCCVSYVLSDRLSTTAARPQAS